MDLVTLKNALAWSVRDNNSIQCELTHMQGGVSYTYLCVIEKSDKALAPNHTATVLGRYTDISPPEEPHYPNDGWIVVGSCQTHSQYLAIGFITNVLFDTFKKAHPWWSGKAPAMLEAVALDKGEPEE